MHLIAVIFAASAVAAAPAGVPGGPAATSATPAASTASVASSAPKRPDPDKLVCRVEEVTGSHMSGRVCKTQAEWDGDTETTGHWLHQLRSGEGAGPLQDPASAN